MSKHIILLNFEFRYFNGTNRVAERWEVGSITPKFREDWLTCKNQLNLLSAYIPKIYRLQLTDERILTWIAVLISIPNYSYQVYKEVHGRILFPYAPPWPSPWQNIVLCGTLAPGVQSLRSWPWEIWSGGNGAGLPRLHQAHKKSEEEWRASQGGGLQEDVQVFNCIAITSITLNTKITITPTITQITQITQEKASTKCSKKLTGCLLCVG